MSWNQAKRESEKWLKTLPLPAELQGATVDLRLYADTLGGKAAFKAMVIAAAARSLKKKGATVYLPPGV